MAYYARESIVAGLFQQHILLTTEERERPRAVLPFGHAQRPHRFAGTAR